MARRTSRTRYRSRGTPRSATYARRAPRRSYGRRTAGRRVGARSGGTIKLVIQTTAAPVASDGIPIGMKTAPKPKRAKL